MSSASLSNSSPQDSRSNIHSSVSEKQIIDNVLAMLNESTAGKERIATLLQLRDSPNFISALTDLRTNGITARDAEYILRLSLNVQSRFIPTLIRNHSAYGRRSNQIYRCYCRFRHTTIFPFTISRITNRIFPQ
jgi:hypothetical protein